MEFARVSLEHTDLDSDERDYKLAFAEQAHIARNQLLAHDPVWFETLRKCLGRAGLVNQYTTMGLAQVAKDHPHQLEEIFLQIWADEASPASLDQFVDDLRALNPTKLSAGGTVGLGALLLFARTPEQYAPYQVRLADGFLKLVGEVPLGPKYFTKRFQQFLNVLDRLLEEASSQGLPLRDRLDAQSLIWRLMKEDPTPTWPGDVAAGLRTWRGDKVAPITEHYQRRAGKSQETEDSAWLILEPALHGQPSPLGGHSTVWSTEAAQQFAELRNTHDPVTGTFSERLRAQVASGDQVVHLLAAELTFLQCVGLSNLRPATKIERVEGLLRQSPDGPRELPVSFREGLQCRGSFNGGAAFNLRAAVHIGWLGRFAEHVSRASRIDLELALSTPWEWMAFTLAVPEDQPEIRHTINYLVWPNYLLPVVVQGHRRKIRDAFSSVLERVRGNGEIELAKDLHEILVVHTRESGRYPEWYADPYITQWAGGEAATSRAWIVPQTQNGRALAEFWQDQEVVSLPSLGLDAESVGASFEEIHAALRGSMDGESATSMRDAAGSIHRFITQMSLGDYVVVPWEEVLLVGQVTGDPDLGTLEGAKFLRTVSWNVTLIVNENLPAQLAAGLQESHAVTDASAASRDIASWFDKDQPAGDEPVVAKPSVSRSQEALQLDAATEDLSSRLHMDRDDLQELVDLLQSRRQIVLYGPPGTGKTYIAKELARHLTGRERTADVQIVQFHPSYSYEDFFEGYRPASANGQVGFELQDGPLRRLARVAGEPGNEDKPFFLIIDEMNRGNLAKIFGELYFLLEYRTDSIRLQYSPTENFILPPNLYIIGTMNTADRSIAMVDAAIRRRFAFVELHPQDGMIRDVLGRYLIAQQRSPLTAELLDSLNEKLGAAKRDLAIGPSHFMRDDAADAAGLRRVWKYELLPLLEEYHFGELSRDDVHAAFGLDALLTSIGRSLEDLDVNVDDEE